MPKFSVMAERATYTPFFKVFEAPTMEAAEQMAEIQVEGLTMRQELTDLGWDEGDSSTEYTVMNDVTEDVSERERLMDARARGEGGHEPGCGSYSGGPCSCSPYKEL